MLGLVIALLAVILLMALPLLFLKKELDIVERDWDYEAGKHLDWENRTFSANRRRKRVEKAFRRQLRRNAGLWGVVETLGQKLIEQEARNQALAADLAAALLQIEDRANVRENLLKKIR